MKSLYLKSSLLVVVFLLAIPSYAALSYHFNAETGLLSISGTGSSMYYGDVDEAIGRKKNDDKNYTLKRVEFTANTGITSIDRRVFNGCVGLASIDIPETVTSIGNYAFYDCGFTTLTIPARVKQIGEGAFVGCDKLLTIICLATTEPETIDDFAFSSDYKNYKRVLYLPNASSGFTASLWGCSSDAAIAYGQYPSDVNCDFNPATGVLAVKGSGTHLSLAEVCAALGRETSSIAFEQKNTTLKSVDFSGAPNISFIGGFVFAYCVNLSGHIELPEALKFIGYAAFLYCNKLSSVAIPETVTYIGEGAFSSCSSLISVNLPLGLTSLESDLFYACKSLTSIKLPPNIPKISYGAFFRCSALKSIILPAYLSTIEFNAFLYCENMETITCLGTSQPSMGSNAFDQGPSKRTLYVPNATTGFTASDWGYDVTIKYGEVGAIGCTDNTSFSVAQSGSDLLLKGLPTGTLYTITNTQGQCIEKGMITGETHTISISTNGIYLVSTGGHTIKVAVKI